MMGGPPRVFGGGLNRLDAFSGFLSREVRTTWTGFHVLVPRHQRFDIKRTPLKRREYGIKIEAPAPGKAIREA
jgi:hypothetical protein